uniref:ABC transporter ATP-binding protein n=1 Tax=Pristionchus pacificus TaxID=54126 RepID=A0A8R1YI68_PRIPA
MVAKIYLEAGQVVNNQQAYDDVISVIWFYSISAAALFATSVDTLRREYLSAILRSNASTLAATSAGAMSSVINENIDTIRDGMGEKSRLLFVQSACISLPLVTLCLLPLGPLCVMIMGLMGKYSAGPMKRQMDFAASAAAIVEEREFLSSMDSSRALSSSLFTQVGVIDAHSGGASKGSVVIAFACVTLASFYMGTVGPHMMSLHKSRIAAAVIYKTVDDSAPSLTVGRTGMNFRGDIVIDGVRFKYATRDGEVLKGLSLRADGGKCIAVAGRSGCGKSTAVSLLTKLYSCTEGKITIDGVNIADIDTKSLRQAIGVVNQEPYLFNGTIRENITLGRKWNGSESEEARLATVMNIEHADGFVSKFEKQRHSTLSGGQNQRIAIARAILMNPSILILDEATSALDVQSESLVQEALADAQSGRTTIVIAHRLSTLKNADVIYVLNEGIVAEEGSHDSLIEKGGIYARMVERQSLFSDVKTIQNSNSPEEKLPVQELQIGTQEYSVAETSTEKKVKWSSFARIYTHGFNGQMALAFLFSILPVWAFLTGAHYISGRCSESVLAFVRTTIFHKVLHRDAKYFDDSKTSNATIVNELNQQLGALAAGLDGRMVVFVWCSMSFTACLAISLWRQWKIGLYEFVFMSRPLYRVSYPSDSSLLPDDKDHGKRSARRSLIALEIFTQARTIQVMTVEEYFERKYDNAQQSIAVIQAIANALNMSAIFVFGAISFATGAKYVYDGQLSAHNLFIIGISIEFCGCCLSIVNPTFPDLVRANAAARILYSYFDLPGLADTGSEKCELNGSLSVQNLQFAYPTRPEHEVILLHNQVEVLRALSISASPGESIALVGPSGCGKSTLFALLKRFYEQRKGDILMDDLDHRQISLSHLRSEIALVGQEPVLFAGTIKENILLGFDGTIDDVRNACKIANISRYIEDLPEGYDTLISSMGRSFSGGQKQRIAIARTLVRNPKILLLDEATSALDGESERLVQDALANASSDRTSLSIAHRLSTIKDATQIFFVENGAGTREELSRVNGKYAAYEKAQSLE